MGLADRTPPSPAGRVGSRTVGLFGAAATVAFEFVFGHYVNQDSWATLVHTTTSATDGCGSSTSSVSPWPRCWPEPGDSIGTAPQTGNRTRGSSLCRRSASAGQQFWPRQCWSPPPGLPCFVSCRNDFHCRLLTTSALPSTGLAGALPLRSGCLDPGLLLGRPAEPAGAMPSHLHQPGPDAVGRRVDIPATCGLPGTGQHWCTCTRWKDVSIRGFSAGYAPSSGQRRRHRRIVEQWRCSAGACACCSGPPATPGRLLPA